MRRIALTGGIACGKSLFCEGLKEEGIEVLDADAVTHRLESPGGLAVEPLVKLFGREILADDGSIDRKRLGKKVFASEEARVAVNAVLHPLVKAEIARWVSEETPGENKIRVAVIPLLFECGWEDEWDTILCLTSSEENQVKRLMQTRGHSETEARQRIASQMPVAEKAARSHFVISNDADKDSLREAAKRTAVWLKSQTG